MQVNRLSWRDCPGVDREELEDLRDEMAAYDALPAEIRAAMVASDEIWDLDYVRHHVRRGTPPAAIAEKISGRRA